MSARISSMYARIFFSLASVSDEVVVFASAFCVLSCAQPEGAMNVGRTIKLVSKIRFSNIIFFYLSCLDFFRLNDNTRLDETLCLHTGSIIPEYRRKLPLIMAATNCQK